MFFFDKLFGNKDRKQKAAIAKLLQVNPEALADFDEAYKRACLAEEDYSEDVKAAIRQRMMKHKDDIDHGIVDRIVSELLQETVRWSYDGEKTFADEYAMLPSPNNNPVTVEEIKRIPLEIRPQLTGDMMMPGLAGPPSYMAILPFYAEYLKDPKTRNAMGFYHRFRQGLDMLDLDAVTYRMLGMNKDSIGYWLPPMIAPIEKEGFFHIPKTTIIKVPLPLLQLTRLDYDSMTATTMAILNKFCFEAFRLDENGDYFIKTGVMSSKFDFRNARVHEPKEIRELGEYLLFLHNHASQLACYDLSGRNSPSIYGAATTNEWCVREFIPDKDNRPTIYNGLPLHTEYRAFVDSPVLGCRCYEAAFRRVRRPERPHNAPRCRNIPYVRSSSSRAV